MSLPPQPWTLLYFGKSGSVFGSADGEVFDMTYVSDVYFLNAADRAKNLLKAQDWPVPGEVIEVAVEINPDKPVQFNPIPGSISESAVRIERYVLSTYYFSDGLTPIKLEACFIKSQKRWYVRR